MINGKGAWAIAKEFTTAQIEGVLVTTNIFKQEKNSQTPRLVALTGAGISAESGLKTFRDAGGLWEGYRPEDVATPRAWDRDPEIVLRFYNERRRSVRAAQPNPGHLALVELEKTFDVTVITQNIDDLHERAGSSKVLHLHGEIFKSQSSKYRELVYEVVGDNLNLGDHCERGAQLRPFIVWFEEPVPLMQKAAELVAQAEIFVVIGTSLAVYPAASLVTAIKRKARVYVVDRQIPTADFPPGTRFFAEPASTGVPRLAAELLTETS